MYFLNYVFKVVEELKRRHIKYQIKFVEEIEKFCCFPDIYDVNYPEHNDRYLKQCYYNLQEKCDRDIISKDEFNKIKKSIYYE